MELYMCNDKVVQGKDTMYQLTNIKNQKTIVVSGDELKNNMRCKRVDVINLTLTSDNRLVLASREKMDKLSDIMNAPAKARHSIEAEASDCHLDGVESYMDEFVKQSIESYIKDFKKYVKLRSINPDKNIIVLEYTVGSNSYVILRYEKIVYGARSTIGAFPVIYGDIAFQLVGVNNGKESYKLDESCVIKTTDLVRNRNTKDALKKDCIKIYLTREGNTDKYKVHSISASHGEVNITTVGKSIMTYIAEQLKKVCENTPEIINNIDLDKYKKKDVTKRDYSRFESGIQEFNTIASTVVLNCIVTKAVVENPLLLTTPLLSKAINGDSKSMLGIYSHLYD